MAKKNAIEKAKELFNQFTSGVGNAVQRGQVGQSGFNPNNKPLFQTPLANAKPINWGQVGQNVVKTVAPIARKVGSYMIDPRNNPLGIGMQLPTPPKINIPEVQRGQGANFGPVSGFVTNNLLRPVAQSFLNTPYNLIQGSNNINQGLQTRDSSKLLTGVGQAGEAALNIIPFAPKTISTVATALTKLPFKTAVLDAAKVGAGYGATYGAAGQLQTDDKSLVSMLKSIGMGAVIGGVAGGGIAAGTNLIGKVIGLITHKPQVVVELQQKAAMQPRNPKTQQYMTNNLVKPKGMPKGAWEFQIKFNSKYNRNPYQPVYGSDLKAAIAYETEKKGVGLSIRDINKDKNPLGPKPVVSAGVPKNIKTEIPSITQLPKTKAPASIVSPKVAEQIPQMEQAQGLVQKKPLLKSKGLPGQSSDSILQKVKDKVNSIYTASLDRFHPLSQLAKQGKEEQSMRNALTGYYGTGSIGKYHTDFELSPILKSVDANDLRSYTIAQRDLELAGRDIKGSNLGNANKIIEGLKQKYGDITKLDQAATKLYDYQKNLVQKYLVDTGIISKENFNAMVSKNQKYVPFKRVMDQVDEFLGTTPQTRGAGSVGSQNVIKGIKGSERQIKDPLESIIENTYKIVGLGKRQQVAQAIINLKDKLPQGIIKPFTGEAGNKPVISVFENGKVQKYLVPPEVADAAKGLSEQGMNIIIKILGAPTRVFRQTATGANPEFALPNISRDIQSAYANIGLNPFKFVSGLAHYMRKDAVYQEFLKSGGLTSRISLDQPFLKQSVKDLTGIKSKGLSLADPRRIYNMLQAIGQASEQPTRIAAFQKVYNQALKQGLSLVEARARGAYAAQEATVNFARRGAVTQPINSIYAFLNARAQGVDRLIRTIKNDPVGTSFRIGLITVAPAIGLYAYNKNFQSYNDPRIVPEYEKQNNFIIMLSDTPIDALGGAQYIKIPKGDIGKIANPIEAFMAYADGKGGDVGSALKSVLTGFSPITNIGDLIPTALRPPIENAANYSFFQQRPIVSESKKNYPAQFQFDKSTPAIYKEIGAKIGQSPAKIANLIRGYLTGFARIGEMMTEPFAKKDTYSGQDVNKTPIVRRFLGGAVRTEDEQALNDYFQQKGILNKVQDIKTGIKYGNIPLEDGMNEINKLLDQTEKLQTQQQSYLGPRAAAATNVSDKRNKLDEDRARLMIQTQGGTQLVNNKFLYTNDNGSVVSMDLSPIQRPKLTGYEDIDKVLTSKYSSRLTTEINNLAKLAELGEITYQQANELIQPIKAEQERIKLSKPKTYKPKKITARRVSVKKTPVPKPIKLKIKTKKFKIPKYKPLPSINFRSL